jgi:hypothetical protein
MKHGLDAEAPSETCSGCREDNRLDGHPDRRHGLDVFNITSHRCQTDAGSGYEYGDAGLRPFAESYGVLETITTIEPEDNAVQGPVTRAVKQRPGASPLLFARFLMDIAAFVSLDDISANLPPYASESSRSAWIRLSPKLTRISNDRLLMRSANTGATPL